MSLHPVILKALASQGQGEAGAEAHQPRVQDLGRGLDQGLHHVNPLLLGDIMTEDRGLHVEEQEVHPHILIEDQVTMITGIIHLTIEGGNIMTEGALLPITEGDLHPIIMIHT